MNQNLLLFQAVKNDNIALVKKLIQDGADLNIHDEIGVIPLVYAIQNDNVEMVELILNNGADPNLRTCTPPNKTLN